MIGHCVFNFGDVYFPPDSLRNEKLAPNFWSQFMASVSRLCVIDLRQVLKTSVFARCECTLCNRDAHETFIIHVDADIMHTTISNFQAGM